MAQKEVFSIRLDAGRNRTYFFDVRKVKKSRSISRLQKVGKGDRFIWSNIIVWPDHIDEFIQTLTDISKRITE